MRLPCTSNLQGALGELCDEDDDGEGNAADAKRLESPSLIGASLLNA